jgi:hypothetical protein
MLALDELPSRTIFDFFRAKQRDPIDWASSTLIRNAFGGGRWQEATSRAQGEPLPDLTSRRLISNGKLFPRSELEPILGHWAAKTRGPLRQADFLAWCREEAEKEKPAFARLPLTANTLERRFGSWADALAAIGELDRCTSYWRRKTEPPTVAAAAEAKEPIDITKLPSQTGGQYSRAQAQAWLKWTRRALHLGKDEPLTYRDYRALRERLMREADDQGQVVHMPSEQAIVRHLGSFRNAQVALGLLKPEHTCASRKRFDDEELFSAVIAAGRSRCHTLGAALSGDLMQARYIAWRKAEMGRARGERVPSLKTLLARLGGRSLRWSEVLRSVKEAHSRSRKSAARAGRAKRTRELRG